MSGTYDYLLDTKNVSYEELLTYLKRRERAYISFLEFCIDKSVLNKKVLLDILKHQDENRTLFIDSLRAVAGEDFCKDLIQVYYSQIPSIFKFIEYSNEMETKINALADADAGSEAGASLAENSEDLSAEADAWVFPVFNAEKLDESPLEDFLDSFSERKRNSLETHILSFSKQEFHQLQDAIAELDQSFLDLKALGQMTKLNVFVGLIQELEEFLPSFQDNSSNLPTAVGELIEEALLLGLDVLWVLRNVLAEHKSELPIAQDKKWVAKVDKMMRTLKKAKAELGEAQQIRTA